MLGMVEFVSTIVEVHKKAVEDWDSRRNSGEEALQKSMWNWYKYNNDVYESIRGGLLQESRDIADYKRCYSWSTIFNHSNYAAIRKYIPE